VTSATRWFGTYEVTRTADPPYRTCPRLVERWLVVRFAEFHRIVVRGADSGALFSGIVALSLTPASPHAESNFMATFSEPRDEA
jgi:hypothetical protein